MDGLLFLTFAAIAVACAINLVVQTHPISSALSLVGVMGSLAVLYLLLGGEFIAAAQLIVYAGAIMVLFIFVIMLLNAGRGAQRANARCWAIGVGVCRCCSAARPCWRLHRCDARPRRPDRASSAHWIGGDATEIGRAIFTDYLLPFEVTSVLILIAIVGAVVLAKKEI